MCFISRTYNINTHNCCSPFSFNGYGMGFGGYGMGFGPSMFLPFMANHCHSTNSFLGGLGAGVGYGLVDAVFNKLC